MLVKVLVGFAASLICTSSAFASYASLAYSGQTGRYGFAAGGQSRAWTENEALRSCGAYDCEIAGSVDNGIIALAIGTNHVTAVGLSSISKSDAFENAVELCREARGRKCRVYVWAQSIGGDCPPGPQPYPGPEQGGPVEGGPSQGAPHQGDYRPTPVPQRPIPVPELPAGPSYPAPRWN